MSQKHEEDREMQKYKVYMLHLEKLIKTGIMPDLTKKRDRNDEEEQRLEKSFFCYGYYDKLTYIEEGKDNCFTYEHMFSIKYPYKRAEQSISADQLFTLLKPKGETQQGGNPFTESRGNTPFLGVFLITIDILDKERTEEAEKFYSIVREHRARLKSLLDDVCKNSDDITEIYYSPNCADLCIVLRTDCLKKIYQMKRMLGRYMEDSNLAGKQSMGVTLYIASEFAQSNKGILSSSNLEKENDKHQIEIRMQCSKKAAGQFQQWLEDKGQTLFGVTGKGDYTFRLDYAHFSAIYPLYVDMKLGEYKEAEKCDYKLEPSVIEIWGKCKFLYERWYLDVKNEGDTGEELTENMDWGKSSWRKKRADICQAMYGALEILQDKVGELTTCGKDENGEECVEFPKQRFMEQYRMVKDLLYTYENLWYDENNISEGRVFYAQMAALLEGINQQIETIRQVSKYMRESNTISISGLRVINNDLIYNMNEMIAGINNFNKLIQAVNQNLRNVPNYEMQSKVNVEKYLYAYTMYLIELCNKYYKKQIGEKKENERIFPMVTISMKGQKIYARSLFRKLQDSKNDDNGLSIFLVQCPNYQRFANAYHVLPMISHEISHCFRYEERGKRNKFILKTMAQGIAEEVIDEFLREGYLKYGQNVKTQHVKFIYDVIWQELTDYMTEALKERLPYIHLNNMDKVCVKEMWNCFGVSEPHKLDEGKLWELCRTDFKKLFDHCHITYVTPLEFKRNPEEYAADGLLNLLLDLLSEDREHLTQWKEVIESNEICEILKGNPLLKNMEDAVSLYDSEHIAISTQLIQAGFDIFSKRVWRGFLAGDDGNIDDWMEKDIQRCMKENSEKMARGEETEPEIGVIETKLGMDEEKSFRLKGYLLEAAALMTEIKQRWMVNGKDIVTAPEEIGKDECVKKIHQNLHAQYKQMLGDLKNNHWIVTKKTQELYASLGIVNGDSKQFVELLQASVRRIDSRYLETVLRDRMRLYSEVFADLGMCKIFGFTPFGYYAYTIHLFIKERELPEALDHNMTEERMKMVIFTLWGGTEKVEENRGELREKINLYKKEIEKYKQKLSGGKEDSKELQMHESMLIWMENIYDVMNFVPSAQVYKLILDYLKEMYMDTEKMDFLKEDTDPIIKRIGNYYNQFIASVGNETLKNEIMDIQNEFVLRYYGKMQDACARVDGLEIDEGKDKSEDGILFVEQYNRQFMQWCMEGER